MADEIAGDDVLDAYSRVVSGVGIQYVVAGNLISHGSASRITSLHREQAPAIA